LEIVRQHTMDVGLVDSTSRLPRAVGPIAESALTSQKGCVMAENTVSTAASKAKSKPVVVAAPAFEIPKFEIPKFEMPKFEMPKFEVPMAFREIAEKGIAQAKENYEKVKSAAEQATDVLEETYSTASKGCASYGLKLVETTRANSDAAFDLMSELMTAKSYSQVVELSSAYLRKQFDALVAQAKELSEHAQKVATDTAEPIKDSISTTFNKAA
jgi:phasin